MEANLLEEKRAVEGMVGRVPRLWLALVSQPLASDTNELGELGEFGSVFGEVAAEPHTVFSVCAGAISSACGPQRADARRYCCQLAPREQKVSFSCYVN